MKTKVNTNIYLQPVSLPLYFLFSLSLTFPVSLLPFPPLFIIVSASLFLSLFFSSTQISPFHFSCPLSLLDVFFSSLLFGKLSLKCCTGKNVYFCLQAGDKCQLFSTLCGVFRYFPLMLCTMCTVFPIHFSLFSGLNSIM